LFGATLGLAYLAKPGVTLLAGCFVLVGLLLWLGARRSNDSLHWTGLRPLIGAALASGVSGLIILPRALDAWEKFGDPLQNTAQRCFWADSWDECFPVGGYLNPRFIDRVPIEDRPTAARFIVRHGWAGAWMRLSQGICIQADNVFQPDRRSLWFERQPSAKRPVRRIFPYRGFFLLPPAALATGLWFVARRMFGANAMSLAAAWQGAFAFLLVLITAGAFAWYAPIASGARFIMALYLPVLASLLIAAEALRRSLAAQWIDCVAAGTWIVMLATITAHLALIATHPYFDRLKGAF
jgi:hypothetical protein